MKNYSGNERKKEAGKPLSINILMDKGFPALYFIKRNARIKKWQRRR